MRHNETRYGFEYGDARIERHCSDEKKGWVAIGLTTSKHSYANGKAIEIYVTKTGKVRISDDYGEWKPPKEEKK